MREPIVRPELAENVREWYKFHMPQDEESALLIKEELTFGDVVESVRKQKSNLKATIGSKKAGEVVREGAWFYVAIEDRELFNKYWERLWNGLGIPKEELGDSFDEPTSMFEIGDARHFNREYTWYLAKRRKEELEPWTDADIGKGYAWYLAKMNKAKYDQINPKDIRKMERNPEEKKRLYFTKEEWLEAIIEKDVEVCFDGCIHWNPKWGDFHEEIDRYYTKKYGRFDIKFSYHYQRLFAGEWDVFGAEGYVWENGRKIKVAAHDYFGQGRRKMGNLIPYALWPKYMTYSTYFDRLRKRLREGDREYKRLKRHMKALRIMFPICALAILIGGYAFLFNIDKFIKNDWVKAVMPFGVAALLLGFIIWRCKMEPGLWGKGRFGRCIKPNKKYYKGKYIDGSCILRASLTALEAAKAEEEIKKHPSTSPIEYPPLTIPEEMKSLHYERCDKRLRIARGKTKNDY